MCTSDACVYVVADVPVRHNPADQQGRLVWITPHALIRGGHLPLAGEGDCWSSVRWALRFARALYVAALFFVAHQNVADGHA